MVLVDCLIISAWVLKQFQELVCIFQILTIKPNWHWNLTAILCCSFTGCQIFCLLAYIFLCFFPSLLFLLRDSISHPIYLFLCHPFQILCCEDSFHFLSPTCLEWPPFPAFTIPAVCSIQPMLLILFHFLHYRLARLYTLLLLHLSLMAWAFL